MQKINEEWETMPENKNTVQASNHAGEVTSSQSNVVIKRSTTRRE